MIGLGSGDFWKLGHCFRLFVVLHELFLRTFCGEVESIVLLEEEAAAAGAAVKECFVTLGVLGLVCTNFKWVVHVKVAFG